MCAHPHSSPQKPQEVRGRDKTPRSNTMHRAEQTNPSLLGSTEKGSAEISRLEPEEAERPGGPEAPEAAWVESYPPPPIKSPSWCSDLSPPRACPPWWRLKGISYLLSHALYFPCGDRERVLEPMNPDPHDATGVSPSHLPSVVTSIRLF